MFEGVKAGDAKADGARSSQIALVLSDEEMKLSDAQRVKRDELERKLETLKARRTEHEGRGLLQRAGRCSQRAVCGLFMSACGFSGEIQEPVSSGSPWLTGECHPAVLCLPGL